MNRDKQIEEIKSIIDKAEEEYSEIWNEWFYDHKEGTKIDNEFLFFAKLLYEAGYRKASDIFAEIESLAHDGAIGGKYPIKVIDPDKFAELRKKYEVTSNEE